MVLVLGVGRCAFRPPRVVFVLGLVSLINSLTSGKKGRGGVEGRDKGAIKRFSYRPHSAIGRCCGKVQEAVEHALAASLQLLVGRVRLHR